MGKRVGPVVLVPWKLDVIAWLEDEVPALTVDAWSLSTPDTVANSVLDPVTASACDVMGTVEVGLTVTCGAVVVQGVREGAAWMTELVPGVVAA